MIINIILALLMCISIGSLVYIYHLSKKDRKIIQLNIERQKENNQLEEEFFRKKNELDNLKETINNQNTVLQSMNFTISNLQENAEKQAQEMYETKLSLLNQDYQKKHQRLEEDFNQKTQDIYKKISVEQVKLQSLQDKQQAYLQAQLRQEEIDSNQDYYRLVVDAIDLNDIKMLRELQLRFFRKEIIDKLIWEVYFKPAYDILMSHLFKSSSKICGVYKITDLTTAQSYIGQSVDIKERFRQHIKTSLSFGQSTNKLYQMMQKSGQQNFIFEILEEVPRGQLNERESYWIDFYKTKEYGLNSTKGNS